MIVVSTLYDVLSFSNQVAFQLQLIKLSSCYLNKVWLIDWWQSAAIVLQTAKDRYWYKYP